ncbi:hypothetical protein D3C76_495740 [compost metagenome]
MGKAPAQLVQLHQAQQVVDDGLALGMLADAEGDVVLHAQVREQRVVLEHHADAALFRRQGEAGAGDHFAVQRDLAFLHRFEAGDGAQGGGLAAARRAEQATDVAGVQVQADVLHHALLLVSAGKIFQVEQQALGHRRGVFGRWSERKRPERNRPQRPILTVFNRDTESVATP